MRSRNALPTAKLNSRTREEALKIRLGTNTETGIVDLVKQTLRSRDSQSNPVRRRVGEPSDGFTYASTIIALPQGARISRWRLVRRINMNTRF